MRSLFILLLSINFAYAQVSVGLYAGLDRSKFSGETTRSFRYEFALGYTGGLICDIGLSKDVFLSLRPSYTQHNAQVRHDLANEDTGGPTFVFPTSTQYLELPVLIKIFVTKGFYANAGIGTSYVLASKTIIEDEEIDFTEHLNDYIFSAFFGFGGTIPIGRSSLNLELTYDQSLSTLTKRSEIEQGLVPRLRTTRFRFAVYYFIFNSKNKK